MRYTILFEQVPVILENRVEELILQGWEPIGGVAVDNNFRFMQAMIYKTKA